MSKDDDHSARGRYDAEPAVLEVLDRFGFSSVESITPLVRTTGRQQSVRVRADGADWVLKRYAESVDLKQVQRSQRLEARLMMAGFPVAPLRQTTSGQVLLWADGAHYAVRGWVHGRQVSITDRDALMRRHPHLVGRLGAMVGTLHRISGEDAENVYDAAEDDPDRLFRAPRHAVRALRRPRPRPPLVSRWQELRLRRRKSEFDRWILEILPGVEAHARQLTRRSVAAELTPADVGLIHHDLNWENIVLDDEGGRPLALLDFDNATPAPWGVEAGAAAVVLAGTDPHLLEQFLTGYESASSFPVDLSLFRRAMELKCVQSILNSVLIYLDGDTDTTLREPWARYLHACLVDLTGIGAPVPLPARLRGSAYGPTVSRVQQEDGHGQRST